MPTGRFGFWKRVVIKPAWWWLLEGVPTVASLVQGLVGVPWWVWVLVAAGIAVILILEGAYRVLQEREREYVSVAEQTRSAYESRLASIRKGVEGTKRLSLGISFVPQVHNYASSNAMGFVTVTNLSNGPIGCHAEGTLCEATVPIRNAGISYAVKWLDNSYNEQEMMLHLPEDKAVLEIANFATKPFFRFGPQYKYHLRYGWAYQLVFHMANRAHPLFYEDIPHHLFRMSIKQAANLIRAGQWSASSQFSRWEVRDGTSFTFRLRLSYWSLLDRTVSDVVVKHYLIKLGPLMGQMQFEEASQ